MSLRLPVSRIVALLVGLASAASAAGAELQLSTEAELRGTETPERIEAFWRSQQADASFTGIDGLKLHGLKFRQPAGQRGAIVLVSGRTESVRKYKETVYDLWRSGYAVYLYDHRGQGESERERDTADRPQMGHVNRFADYVADLQTFIAGRVLPDGHRRHYLLAHSMGGAITARYLQTGPTAQLQHFGAAVLMSPMLQIKGLIGDLPADVFSCHLAAMNVALGRATRYRIGGKDYEPRDFASNDYTHSPVRYARLLDEYARLPDIRIGAQSWGWVDEACTGAELARKEAARVRTPVLVIVAEKDSIVHNAGAVTFCANRRGCDGTSDGGPLSVAAARHELMIERDEARGRALRAAAAFFDRHQ